MLQPVAAPESTPAFGAARTHWVVPLKAFPLWQRTTQYVVCAFNRALAGVVNAFRALAVNGLGFVSV